MVIYYLYFPCELRTGIHRFTLEDKGLAIERLSLTKILILPAWTLSDDVKLCALIVTEGF